MSGSLWPVIFDTRVVVAQSVGGWADKRRDISSQSQCQQNKGVLVAREGARTPSEHHQWCTLPWPTSSWGMLQHPSPERVIAVKGKKHTLVNLCLSNLNSYVCV